jgi:UDP-N-acetylglucosamine 1-carboxyvinyltransferase
MSRYIVNGGQKLQGEILIRGAKNASYKQIIASLLSSETTEITNIPNISDVKITQSIAEKLGSIFEPCGRHCLKITTPKIKNNVVPHGVGVKSRTSFMFSAPLLVRTGKAIFPVPGGDRLGSRPLDRLFDCFKKMNIKITEDNDTIILETDQIKAVDYTFTKPSHTVTETVIMTAVLASGQSILRNSAQEPEINDLILLLNSMGAKIERQKDDPKTIIIQGVQSLSGTKHQVIPDRNEVVTFVCAALATKGSVNILRCNPNNVKFFLETIAKMGAKVELGSDEITVSWVQPLKAINIETGPAPMFMTDWQALFSILLTQSIGCSSVIERVYPNRFQHIANLQKMGAKIKFFNPKVEDPATYYQFNPENDRPDYFHGVKIYGPTKLKAADFKIDDLRAGALTTLAALVAKGVSTIDGVEFIERGYEKLAERLSSLGANIEYIKT